MSGGAFRVDRPDVARLTVSGADAKDFLHRITSNDTASLEPGEGCATLLLERTGRFVDRLIACERGDHRLLIGSPGRGEAVRAFLERYVIADDVEVRSLEETHRLVTVFGPEAAAVLGAATGRSLTGVPRFHVRALGETGEEAVVRAEDVGGPAYHVLVTPGSAAAGALAGIPEAGADEWRARRIAAGVPEFGDEYGDRTVSLETRMFDAIDLQKGCFVGQEVVARLHNFKRVKRGLVHLRIEGDAVPARGAALFSPAGDEPLGEVVSAAGTDAGVFALGYVAAGSEAAGGTLAVAEGDRRRAARVLPLALAGEAA